MWLLVIDFPDERVTRYPEYDHMHAWMLREGEVHQMQRLLSDRLGGDHEILGPVVICCPRCGAAPDIEVPPDEPAPPTVTTLRRSVGLAGPSGDA